MARRRSKRSTVRGKPNYLWINTAGDLAKVDGNSVWDALLIPADWSGTVTETQCTLLRMVVSVYTKTFGATGLPHASNACIVLGSASEGAGSDTNDIDSYADWPTFFQAYDRVLRIFRLEWAAGPNMGNPQLDVQFSQLPEPVMNLKTPRRLLGDDSVRLVIGGGPTPLTTEVYSITWFCRSLVRTGLR